MKAGDADRASDATRRLAAMTISGSPWAAGIVARGNALLSVGGDAEALYDESLTLLGQIPLLPELARSTCSLGSGCAERIGGSTHGIICASPTRASPRWAPTASQTGPAANWWRPARGVAGGSSRPAATSLPGSCTSPARTRRAHESRDRRRALPQRPNGRMASAQGVQQAGDQLSPRAQGGAARSPAVGACPTGSENQGSTKGPPLARPRHDPPTLKGTGRAWKVKEKPMYRHCVQRPLELAS